MVFPRFNRIRRTERLARETSRERAGMIRSGRLISVSTTGEATVRFSGRLGEADAIGLLALIDDIENLVGLNVTCLFPSGRTRDGGYIIGPQGSLRDLARFVDLSAAPNYLMAREEVTGTQYPFSQVTNTPAWTGTGIVQLGQTVRIHAVILVVPGMAVTAGTPVMTFTVGSEQVTFRQVGFDGTNYTLAPAYPIRVQAPASSTVSIAMTLTVNRLEIDQRTTATMNAHYTTDSQPTNQRLQITTLTGAGRPYMRIQGRSS